MSRTKASFAHLQLADFEGCLAPKLRFHIFNFQIWRGCLAPKLCFHIFNFQILREHSHQSFVLTSSTVRFSGRSRTKASFSNPFQILREVSNEMAFFESWRMHERSVLQDKTCLGRWMGKLCRATGAEHSRLYTVYRDHSRIVCVRNFCSWTS